MNISSQDNSVSMQGKWKWYQKLKDNAGQKCLDMIPYHTYKETDRGLEKMKKADEFMSDPMWNRGIMGLTAVCTQPVIDYNNHKVDKETREISAIRTLCKIIAGTTVGMFCVRGPMRNIVKSLTDINGKGKYSKLLLPKKYLGEISKNEKFLKNYRSTLAMMLSLGVMTITNFVLDAPFTIFLTNLALDKRKSGADKGKNTRVNDSKESDISDKTIIENRKEVNING